MYFTEVEFAFGDIIIIFFSLILSWTTYPMIKELVRTIFLRRDQRISFFKEKDSKNFQSYLLVFMFLPLSLFIFFITLSYPSSVIIDGTIGKAHLWSLAPFFFIAAIILTIIFAHTLLSTYYRLKSKR